MKEAKLYKQELKLSNISSILGSAYKILRGQRQEYLLLLRKYFRELTKQTRIMTTKQIVQQQK